MAKLKPVRVDGQTVVVDTGTKLDSLLAPDVQSVRTNQGALITRADFARVPIPDGFETNLSAINKGGGKQGRRPVVIDGTYREVSAGASLHDVVRPEVDSVRTSDGAIISRADFAHVPVPAGFETNLSRISKGKSVANLAMATGLSIGSDVQAPFRSAVVPGSGDSISLIVEGRNRQQGRACAVRPADAPRSGGTEPMTNPIHSAWCGVAIQTSALPIADVILCKLLDTRKVNFGGVMGDQGN